MQSHSLSPPPVATPSPLCYTDLILNSVTHSHSLGKATLSPNRQSPHPPHGATPTSSSTQTKVLKRSNLTSSIPICAARSNTGTRLAKSPSLPTTGRHTLPTAQHRPHPQLRPSLTSSIPICAARSHTGTRLAKSPSLPTTGRHTLPTAQHRPHPQLRFYLGNLLGTKVINRPSLTSSIPICTTRSHTGTRLAKSPSLPTTGRHTLPTAQHRPHPQLKAQNPLPNTPEARYHKTTNYLEKTKVIKRPSLTSSIPICAARSHTGTRVAKSPSLPTTGRNTLPTAQHRPHPQLRPSLTSSIPICTARSHTGTRLAKSPSLPTAGRHTLPTAQHRPHAQLRLFRVTHRHSLGKVTVSPHYRSPLPPHGATPTPSSTQARYHKATNYLEKTKVINRPSLTSSIPICAARSHTGTRLAKSPSLPTTGRHTLPTAQHRPHPQLSVLARPQPQDIYPHGFVSGSSRPASQGVTNPGIALVQARLTSEFSWDPKPKRETIDVPVDSKLRILAGKKVCEKVFVSTFCTLNMNDQLDMFLPDRKESIIIHNHFFCCCYYYYYCKLLLTTTTTTTTTTIVNYYYYLYLYYITSTMCLH
ncbi:hypothetical protein LguiA_029017 [Lonicera macranthoides]